MNFTKAITTRVLVITAAAVAVAASAASAESRKFKANGSYISVDGYDASGCVWTWNRRPPRRHARAAPDVSELLLLGRLHIDGARVRVGDDFERRVQRSTASGRHWTSAPRRYPGSRLPATRAASNSPWKRTARGPTNSRDTSDPRARPSPTNGTEREPTNCTGSGQPVRGSDRTAARRIRRQP